MTSDLSRPEPPFTIVADAGHNLLRITLHGFWSPKVAEDFGVELARVRSAMIACGRSADLARVLVVLRYAGVQPQEVAAQLQLEAARQGVDDGRLAVVLAGAQLQRMQVGRIIAGDRHRSFSSEADALAWLTADA